MTSTPLLDRLRALHWRLTPQRRVIAETMRGDHVHLTAEEVLERARERLPEVSLATVYNTLNELVSMGEVQQVDAGDGPTRYDPNTEDGHHHLVLKKQIGSQRAAVSTARQIAKRAYQVLSALENAA